MSLVPVLLNLCFSSFLSVRTLTWRAPRQFWGLEGAQPSYLPAVPSTCLQTGKAPCASSGCPQMGPSVTMYPAGGRLGLTCSQARQLPTRVLLLPTTWM